jgi:anti-anti-sigma factor
MFAITREPGGTIKLSGKMHDAHSAQALEILNSINDSCTLDFSDLVYISSSGLGLLLQAQKRLEGSGHGLTLVGMSDHVRELFAVTRFDLIFDIK